MAQCFADLRFYPLVEHSVEELLLAEAVKSIPRRSREVVLDSDATDDPLHGAQEGAFFHGDYRNYC